MATLSANSRRNSAASTSVPSSPRPSLTGTGAANSNINGMLNGSTVTQSIPSFHMTSVNEEESVTDVRTEEEEQTNITSSNKNRLNICSERSDSGFSECSNSSGNAAVSNGAHVTTTNGHVNNTSTNSHTLFSKAYSISEEKSSDVSVTLPDNANLKEAVGQVSVNALKSRLEKMAEAQKEISGSRRTSITEKESSSPKAESKTPIMKRTTVHDLIMAKESAKDPLDQVAEIPRTPSKTTLVRSASLQHKKSPSIEKEPIMKSDFTYTIKMRKKSLECNALKEKQATMSRVPLEISGRVSKLMQRFNVETSSNVSEPNSTPSTPSRIDFSPFECFQSKPIVEFEDEIPEPIKHDEYMKLSSPLVDVSPTTTITDMTSITTPKLVPAAVVAKPVFVEATSEFTENMVTKTKSSFRNVRTATVSSSVKNTEDLVHTRENVSMESKSVFDRLSQSKLTNSTKPSNQSAKAFTHSVANNPKANNNKKQFNTDTVDTTSRRSTTTSPTSVRKTTAYASFNRTSPVRLSNRVKEVTDRLATPKAIRKPTVNKTVLGKNTVSSAIAAASAKSMTVETGRATTSTTRSSKAAMTSTMTTAEAVAVVTETTVTTTAVTVNESTITRAHDNTVLSPSAVKQSVNNLNFAQIDEKHKFSKNKIDGEFTLKSKMNENFKKASAFWKAT